ncbi:alcohol dehydrogenase zinc-binding domain-containing protein [Rhodanobacter thiooxydans LCS2]|nr:alcohol dehydrogenase zinc-binding domain-containing protein [Rhodanobacter thiooxydans LCS2]
MAAWPKPRKCWISAEKGIVANIEMITAQQIDKAYDCMARSDVKHRFVIDNSPLAG